MKLFSLRWLAQWIPIRKSIEKAEPRFEKVMIAGFEAGPAAVSLRQLEAAVAARDFRAVDVAIGPGIAAIQQELLATVPSEYLRAIIAGADTESENPTRALAASAPPKSKIGLRFDATNPRATMWASMRSAALVREVTKSQRETIRQVLGDAYRANMGTRPTAALLRGVLPLDSRRAAIAQRAFEKGGEAAMKKEIAKQIAARAKVIARTEITMATNEGQRMMWQEKVKAGLLPKNMERVWITTPDDRLCPICAPLDGQRAPIDGDFPSGHAGPPAHPQCRCAQGLEQAALAGPNAGQTLGPGVPQASPAKKAKTPSQKVMDEVGLPNLSIAPPNPSAAADDPDWDMVNDPAKAWQGRIKIAELQKELFKSHGVDVVLPSTGLDHTTVEGRMVISGVLTSMRLAKSSKDVLVKAGLITDNQSLPYELRFTKNPTQGAAFLYADTAYTPAGNVKEQAIVVNLASPSWVNLTALKSALKANHDAGFLAGESPESVFIHELGHLHHAQNAPTIHKNAAAFWEDGTKKQLAAYVSKYAATKPVEFIAEMYAGMAEGTTYSQQVESLYLSLGGVMPKSGGAKSGMAASTISQAPPAITVKAPNIKAPIPQGPEGDIVKKVLELKKQGLSYNKIEAAMGWPPQKGFKAFAIVKKYGDSANAAAESPTAAPVKGEGTGSAAIKPAAAVKPYATAKDTATAALKEIGFSVSDKELALIAKGIEAGDSPDFIAKKVSPGDSALTAAIAKAQKLAGTGLTKDDLSGYFKPAPVKAAPPVFDQDSPAPDDGIDEDFNAPIETKIPIKPVTPTNSQPSTAFFDELLKTKISGAKGSNAGGVYATASGEQYYAKFYKDPGQGKGEHLANTIYNKIGLKTPESVIGKDSSGQQIYASKWMKGLKGTAADQGYDGQQASKFMDGFLADVFTANWDAVGLTLDNFGFTDTGDIVRLDQGGSFLFRAQAGKKPADLLNKITEWDSFFQKNPQYAKVAAKAGVTKAEDLGGDRLNQQLNRLKMLVPDWQKKADWRKFVDDNAASMDETDKQQVAEMLAARIKLIDQKVKDAAGIPPKPIPAAPPPPPLSSGYNIVTPGTPSAPPVPIIPAPQQTVVSPQPTALLPPLPKTTKNNPTSYISGANEKKIKDLTTQGYSPKQIADHLGITHAGIKSVVDQMGGGGITIAPSASGPPHKTKITPDKPYGDLVFVPDNYGTAVVKVKVPEKPYPTLFTKYQVNIIRKLGKDSNGVININDLKDTLSNFTDSEKLLLADGMGFKIDYSPKKLDVVQPGIVPVDSIGRRDMPRPNQSTQVDQMNKYHNPYLNSLPTNQRNQIVSYTGSWYGSVNDFLRSSSPSKYNTGPDMQRKVDILQTALMNAPKPPPPAMVYRTQGLDAALESALQPGVEFKMKGFQSSTLNENLNFGGGKAMFEIIPKRGAWVHPISANPGYGTKQELEYLLPHGQTYRVLSVKKLGGKIIYRMEML